MATIDQLSVTTTLSAQDKLPVFSAEQTDTRAATVQTLTDYIDTALIDPVDADIAAIEADVTALQTDVTALENRPAYHHGQNFWRAIRADQRDVYAFVNSDSTWNSSGEPFYRWITEVFASQVPTHSIVYRLWVDGSGWQTPVTIQTGTGAYTVYFDNCAVPGSGLVYTQGGNESLIFADGRVYDLVIFNHGHNLGFTTTEESNYPLIYTAVANMMALHSKADFFVTLQNPWLRELNFSRATQAGWRRIATELGLGIIDVASRFEALGDLNNPAIGGYSAAVTFTNGSATIAGSGLPTTAGAPVTFETAGTLPTNFSTNTIYYVRAGGTSTAMTVAATVGGSAVVAGSAGSGTHSVWVQGTVDNTYYEQDGFSGLHPLEPTGVNVALPALSEALAEGDPTGSTAMVRPLSREAINLLPNPKYTNWTGSAPDGHTFTNVTPSKSVAFSETGLYGMALTCTAGASPVKSVDISSILPAARRRFITYMARVWVPTGVSNTAGRVQIVTTGASSRSFASSATGVGRDGWRWVMACHPIFDTDTTITLNLLCGDAAGADSGLSIYVDRELVFIGTLPGDLDQSGLTGAFLTDFYNFRQTGIPSGFTGTLALSGAASNTFTVTGGTAALTRAFGNINTVPGRIYRVSWGTRTVTGAAGCSLSARGPGGLAGQYSVTTTNGTPNLTGVSVNLAVGQPISGTGIPSGTTIIAVGTGTAVMSANATASGTITATTSTATVGSNGSFIFQAFLPVHSFSVNGGSNVTGFEFQGLSVVEVFSGITPVNRLNLMNGRNTNGTALDATGSATNFAISSTPGTSLRLLGASATGLTRTNTATYEVTLPSSYIPGRDVILTANANRTGTGTAGTNTVDFAAYRIADDGTQGADLVTTAAQAITATAADYSFIVTGTGLVAGDRLLVQVVTVMQETGAVNPLTAQVNSIRVS